MTSKQKPVVATAKQEEEMNREVKITIKLGDLNVVLGGLQELPHKVSARVINDLIQQAQKQLKPEGKAPKVPEPANLGKK